MSSTTVRRKPIPRAIIRGSKVSRTVYTDRYNGEDDERVDIRRRSREPGTSESRYHGENDQE